MVAWCEKPVYESVRTHAVNSMKEVAADVIRSPTDTSVSRRVSGSTRPQSSSDMSGQPQDAVTPRDILSVGTVLRNTIRSAQPLDAPDGQDGVSSPFLRLETEFPAHRPQKLPEEFVATLRKTFRRNGLAVVRKFATDDVVDKLITQGLASLIASLDERVKLGEFPPEHVQYDDVSLRGTLKQIQQVQSKSVSIGTLVDSRMAPIAKAVLGEEVVLKNVQFFDKPPTRCYAPGQGSKATPPHQDAYYFMLAPPHRACTLWLALDSADEDTGCLVYELGSHASETIRPHGPSDVMGFSQVLLDYSANNERELAIPVAPGDLIVHHSRTAHRAGPNLSSSQHRRAIGAIFYAASARFDKKLFEARQSDIHRRASQLDGQGGGIAQLPENSEK